jgi:hypothetical protein
VTPARSGRPRRTSRPSARCRPQRCDARSSDHGIGRRRRDPRHPGSSRPAVPRLIPWGVDRKSPRSRPCRRRRRPKSHLRGRRRSLPVPPSPACRRRESTHGARPARSSTPGMAARLAASPGAGPVLPRPATILPNLDHPRCALSYLSMSLLDFSEWPLPMRLGRSATQPAPQVSVLIGSGIVLSPIARRSPRRSDHWAASPPASS